MEATHYPRRVLLAVSGLSPQIVTETLYALSVNQESPWVPTEIHLVTTQEGREIVRHSLLNPEHGYFYRLIEEYELPDINFSIENVHVIEDKAGTALEDIRTEQDNQACADMMVEIVRELSGDAQAELHVSIAGGRKTMGYYMGYALSLYGRFQDKLSHVLVNAPYESHPEFYFPTKESHLIHTRGDRPRAYDTREARVSLAEIPFVRLRDGLPPSLQKGQAGFYQTVLAAQRALDEPELIIDLENRRLSLSGEIIDHVAPAELAFYSWMARRCCNGADAVRYGDEGIAREFLGEYQRIVEEFSGEYERAEESLKNGMNKEDFEYRKSRTKEMLKKNLPPQLLAKYEIASIGKRPNTRYGLRLKADSIRYNRLPAVQDSSFGNKTSATKTSV